MISAQSVGDAWPTPTVTGLHRTVQCATGLSGVPRGLVEATVGFAK
jgi:hypothetical protein